MRYRCKILFCRNRKKEKENIYSENDFIKDINNGINVIDNSEQMYKCILKETECAWLNESQKRARGCSK